MAEGAARLGHQARQAGHDRRQPGVEVGDDQHRARRRVVADVHRPRGRPAAGADAAGIAARRPAPPGVPSGVSRNRAGSGRGGSATGSIRSARSAGTARVRGRRPQLVEPEEPHRRPGRGARRRTPAAAPISGGRPGRQLLDPAGPQPQRLAHDRLVAGGDGHGDRGRRPVAEVDRGGDAHRGRRCATDPRRRQRQHHRVRSRPASSRSTPSACASASADSASEAAVTPSPVSGTSMPASAS